ncbi:NAD(P)-binding protein [Calocera cornea HHB12733]|uniref:NAD(P)-binding protein n=1 Tax=Calocera cornea HHB12733 TaxID=1353952 RepID=A0A165E950_9BASI|nr:NAD(P)-binding protein [Calocera cornea HHB12733]
MAPIVWLVSGAARGVGLGIVTQLAARANTIVFAGTRSSSNLTDLHALSAQHPNKVHIVQLTSADKADNDAAVASIKEIAGRLDVVIANAGLSDTFDRSLDVPLKAMRDHFEVNVLGPLVLFQATYPLLKASTDKPKFIVISSQLGSITLAPRRPVPVTAYGTSNILVSVPALSTLSTIYANGHAAVTIPIQPGVVDTDMHASARKINPGVLSPPTITPEVSAHGILNVVDNAELDEDGPKLTRWDGVILPW